MGRGPRFSKGAERGLQVLGWGIGIYLCMDSREAKAVSSSRRIASRAGLWGGRGATAPLTPDGEIEVAHCQPESSRSTVLGVRLEKTSAARPGLGGPRAGGAACAEPTLPIRSTPSCSGVAKSTNRVESCAEFAFRLGHTSWSATFLEISVY